MTTRRQPGEGAPPVAAQPRVERLTRAEFWGSLAVSLAIFLFSQGAIWQHPWDMALVNGAIVYSYLPIPLVVAALLARGRRLNAKGLFLDVLELTLLKYVVTFGVALALWARAGAPPRRPPRAHDAPLDGTVESPPTPTPIPAERRADLSGLVLIGGAPAGGALAYVAAGLEDYVFAPPAAPLALQNDGTGVFPAIAGVQVSQAISARSTDGRLHTLVAAKDGAALFNIPLMSSGVASTTVARGEPGFASVRCSVHEADGRERVATLGVFSHPFFATTSEDGRFRFNGVPAGHLRVEARIAHSRAGSVAVVLEPGQPRDVTISVEGSRD